MDPRPRVVRLQHVGIMYPGGPAAVEAARHFYGEILGLDELAVPPALPGKLLWYAAGDLELHLIDEPEETSLNRQSGRHPCLQVDDVVAFRSMLDTAGVPTIDNNGEIPGRPRFFVRDPFGNLIEFVEFRPDHW